MINALASILSPNNTCFCLLTQAALSTSFEMAAQASSAKLQHISTLSIGKLETKHYIANKHYTVGVELESTGIGAHNDTIPGVAPRKRLPGQSRHRRVRLHKVRIRGRWRGPYFSSKHYVQFCLIIKPRMNIEWHQDIELVVDYINTINIMMNATLSRITRRNNLDHNHKVIDMEKPDKKEIDAELAKYRRRRRNRRGIRDYQKQQQLKEQDYRRRMEHLKAMQQKENEVNVDSF